MGGYRTQVEASVHQKFSLARVNEFAALEFSYRRGLLLKNQSYQSEVILQWQFEQAVVCLELDRYTPDPFVDSVVVARTIEFAVDWLVDSLLKAVAEIHKLCCFVDGYFVLQVY
jgi:hypothetical protein